MRARGGEVIALKKCPQPRAAFWPYYYCNNEGSWLDLSFHNSAHSPYVNSQSPLSLWAVCG